MRTLAGGDLSLPADIQWSDLGFISQWVLVIALIITLIGIVVLRQVAGRSIALMVTVVVAGMPASAGGQTPVLAIFQGRRSLVPAILATSGIQPLALRAELLKTLEMTPVGSTARWVAEEAIGSGATALTSIASSAITAATARSSTSAPGPIRAT